MMDSALLLGIVALVQVILLAIITQWGKSRDKKEDWRRQDEVAERVAAAAKEVSTRAELLLKANEDAVRRELEVAKLAAAADIRITDQLRAIDEQGQKIHTLVNSEMTQARTNERDQTKLLLVALKQVRGLSVKLGLKPSIEETRDIEDAESKITELNQILEERRAAQAKIDSKPTLVIQQKPIEVTIVNPASEPVPVKDSPAIDGKKDS